MIPGYYVATRREKLPRKLVLHTHERHFHVCIQIYFIIHKL